MYTESKTTNSWYIYTASQYMKLYELINQSKLLKICILTYVTCIKLSYKSDHELRIHALNDKYSAYIMYIKLKL